MTKFKLNARSVVRFAKRNSLKIVRASSKNCGVGMALRAAGSKNTSWLYSHQGMTGAARTLGITTDQLRSLENGFELRPTDENPHRHFFNTNLMPKKLDMRYYNMGRNIRRIAQEEGVLNS